MRTYKITTFNGESTYDVTIDETGVVSVNGLPSTTAGDLKSSVSRHMKRHGLPPATALGVSVGSYATIVEADKNV